jgi:DNA mismatch repair ATPase MutS
MYRARDKAVIPLTESVCAGRHLLTEQMVGSFIPNDTDVSDAAGRVNVRACSSTC